MAHRPHRQRQPLGIPPVPPAGEVLARLGELEDAFKRMNDRADSRRANGGPVERDPARAAALEAERERIAARFEAARLVPITERAAEYVIVHNDDGSYAGLRRA